MIVFADVETTTVDERDGHLLEVSMIATDDNLVERTGVSVLINPVDTTIDKIEFPLIVREMHEKSGLIDDLMSGKGKNICDAQMKLHEWVHDEFKEITGLRRIPLAGFSIAFDRRWLQFHMRELNELFSHRSIDVSSLTELAMRWAPEIYNGRPRPPKGAPHRALDDVRASIATLRYYRDSGLIRNTL